MDFLQGIYDGITWAINALQGLLEDLAEMVQLATDAVASVTDYLSWLPPSYVSILIVGLGVALIYIIVGRE